MRNAFAYPAVFLRLPIRAGAGTGAGPLRDWGPVRRNRAGIVSMHDRDHGDGGPMIAWVERILAGAGIRDAGGQVWLHAMPRLLGYGFNPVCFYFCERVDGRLRAIICEVNNTFGERHCYLLAHPDERPIGCGEALHAPKAFHVSPFCRIEGGYRFRFMLSPPRDGAPFGCFVARIDYDDAQGPLLQTSISARFGPLDAGGLAAALLRTPTLALGVSAKIRWQALKLLVKRVPWQTKPMPPAAESSPSGPYAEPRDD